MSKKNEGTLMYIYRQDPMVKEFKYRRTYIYSAVKNGLSDEQIQYSGNLKIKKDKEGNFLIPPKKNRDSFNAINAFAITRQVLTMYERALNRMGKTKEKGYDLKKLWGLKLSIKLETTPIIKRQNFTSLYSYKQGVRNEIIHRVLQVKNFKTGEIEEIFTAQSFDLIAHEAGHAVYAALRPKYTKETHFEAISFREAFCDLTVVFSLLAQMDVCEACIAESKLNISKSFLSKIAEQVGFWKYRKRDFIRSLSNIKNYKKAFDRHYPNREFHAFSLVFSCAYFNFMVRLFEDYLKIEEYDPAETLFRVGRYATALLILAVVRTSNSKKISYKKIGLEMVKLIKKPKAYDIMQPPKVRKKWSDILLNVLKESKIIKK